ncbi:MAG: hypothetical protein M3P27_03310 [Acidobacteriota bacterium]|nr:hypothetical protein [Acidobacteriota bacterium]
MKTAEDAEEGQMKAGGGEEKRKSNRKRDKKDRKGRKEKKRQERKEKQKKEEVFPPLLLSSCFHLTLTYVSPGLECM